VTRFEAIAQFDGCEGVETESRNARSGRLRRRVVPECLGRLGPDEVEHRDVIGRRQAAGHRARGRRPSAVFPTRPSRSPEAFQHRQACPVAARPVASQRRRLARGHCGVEQRESWSVPSGRRPRGEAVARPSSRMSPVNPDACAHSPHAIDVRDGLRPACDERGHRVKRWRAVVRLAGRPSVPATEEQEERRQIVIAVSSASQRAPSAFGPRRAPASPHPATSPWRLPALRGMDDGGQWTLAVDRAEHRRRPHRGRHIRRRRTSRRHPAASSSVASSSATEPFARWRLTSRTWRAPCAVAIVPATSPPSWPVPPVMRIVPSGFSGGGRVSTTLADIGALAQQPQGVLPVASRTPAPARRGPPPASTLRRSRAATRPCDQRRRVEIDRSVTDAGVRLFDGLGVAMSALPSSTKSPPRGSSASEA